MLAIRILVFTQMTRLMDIFESFFEYRKIKYLRLDGTTKYEDRDERTKLFNKKDSEFPVFILSTRAGGLGLNLQTADTVVLVDSDWNPQMDLQAQDRAHRLGQTREVRVFRLITNTEAEEGILNKACFKKTLDDMVIQAGLFNQKSSDVERRERIEQMIRKPEISGEEDSDVPNDSEINQMLARDESEYELYQEMDRKRYEQERRVYKNFDMSINYRLMQPHEVPEWVKTPVVDYIQSGGRQEDWRAGQEKVQDETDGVRRGPGR
jgi:superfamily II DNA/RNA helicase